MTGSEDIVVIQRGFGVAIAGTVGTNSLVDGSVTNAKLASDAVTSDKTSFTDLTVSSPLTVQSDGSQLDGFGGIEVGGPSGGYIDFKSPASDDYDGRILVGTSTLDIHGKQGVIINTGDQVAVTAIKALADGKVRIGGATNPTHALDVTGDVNITGDYKVNGTNLQTVPTGTVSAFAGSTAPTGYALCDGSPVNTHTEAALHAVVSDTYGGTAYNEGVTDQIGVNTTFNLPDLRGRVVAGFGESLLGATADTLGEDNGVIADTKEHLLTAAESGLPNHDHSVGYQFSNSEISPGNNSALRHGGTNTTGEVTAQDASSAHNNVQPTIILNYIIKK
jgi:microcystin-dependent protein